MSNDPAPPPSESPVFRSEFDRPPGVYFDAIGDAWKLMQREFATWIAIGILVVILGGVAWLPLAFGSAFYEYGGSFTLESISHPPPFMVQVIGGFIQQLFCLVWFPLSTGISWVALKQIRGEPISVGTLFEFGRALPRLFVAAVVFGILVGIGYILASIPGLYGSAAFSFAGLLILDRKLPAAEALVTSAQVLGRRTWSMLLLRVVMFFLLLCGFCLFLVGAAVTIPLFYIVVALHYRYFFDTEPAVV